MHFMICTQSLDDRIVIGASAGFRKEVEPISVYLHAIQAMIKSI